MAKSIEVRFYKSDAEGLPILVWPSALFFGMMFIRYSVSMSFRSIRTWGRYSLGPLDNSGSYAAARVEHRHLKQ